MKTLLSLLTALLIFMVALPAHAARGFGATDGTATTDKITTGHTTLNTSTSWCAWFWLTGAGGGSFGRIFDKDGGSTGKRVLFYNDVGVKLSLLVNWSGSPAQWSIDAPATGAWNHVCVTYAGTDTTTDPIFYLNNTTPVVTEDTAPLTALETNTGAYIIGNRADNIRNLNGRVAEFAVWEGTILSAGNVAALYNSGSGARADSIATQPTTYWKLCGVDSPEPNEMAGGSTGAVTGALQKTHPFSNCSTTTTWPTGCGAAMILLGKGAGC